MAETVRISARSNHGCWTCRLRKKKCDENRPVCSACISLELECHGYGPRPGWMDNGVLQRDQASKFKRLVSQAKSKKGRRQQLLANQSPLVSTIGMRSATARNISSPAAVSQHFFDEQLGAFPQDEFNYPDSGIGSSNSIDTLWTYWPPNDLSIMDDASLDLEGYSSTYTTCQNQHSAPPLVSPMAFENIVSGMDIQSPIDQSTSSSLNELQGSASQDHGYHFKETASANNYDHVASYSQMANPSGDTEDALFMYYLDEVFYIQYPFFHCQKKQGRGWLFAILRRVKSTYHAALALSERQLLSSSSPQNSDIASSLIQLRAQNSHYDKAIQEMQVMINDQNASKGRDLLLGSIEVLMSILQLLFFEVGKQ
ncbi:C6 transcription factor [Penicillium robsamsonii]|uniref:C6 transcription factor n=1 Tax=Penicillium robsamsonii TaxID=1792511 RepID=UPI002548694C|nr:C6 transcription factor [Penicillium robsamsonii]KAJ5834669.1 C6 transcription factor [Penicillium robsamsonii]